MQRALKRVVLAAALSGAIAHSGFVHAAPGLHTNPAALEKGLAQSYDSGRRAYEAGDYVKAAQTWNSLLGRIPESPASRTQRAEIIVDVMAAYQAAFERSGEAAQLRTGMDAYYAYFRAYRQAHSSSNIPRGVVEARNLMKQTLARADAGSSDSKAAAPATGNAAPSGEAPSSTPPPPDATSSAGASKAAATNSGVSLTPGGDSGASDRTGTPLIATGAVLVALGAGASAMIAVGAINGRRAREDQRQEGLTLQQRDNIHRQGRTANALLIAGAVLTPVLVITGVSLITKGAIDKRKARLAVAPTVTPRFAGVVLRGRF